MGFSKPDDDLGGYHLVWPRDLVEIVVDGTLKVDTPRGPVWRRYQGDGYGEHPDSGPFDGTGVGRAWPLLTGERAHYEGADFVVCVE